MSAAARISAVSGPDDARRCLDGLVDLLLDVVEGGASVGFMWPLPRQRAQEFWLGVINGVVRRERVLLVAEDAAGRMLGTVQLLLSLPDNQPHRADLLKLLVHREARRQGLATRLLAAAEQAARAAGRDLLVLDTVTGGAGEQVYLRSGWQRVGAIPRYALMPDGAPCATTYFYKAL